jgi:hypothetical protein
MIDEIEGNTVLNLLYLNAEAGKAGFVDIRRTPAGGPPAD